MASSGGSANYELRRQHFFTDSTNLATEEVRHAASLEAESFEEHVPAPKTGKTPRLISALVQYAEQQDRQDSKYETRRLRNNLRTWLYGPCIDLPMEDKELMESFENVVTGEQSMFRATITNIRLGNARKQLRPLHLEAAVLLAVITASGMPMLTRYLWKYRRVLAKAVGGTPDYVEFGIRLYDRSLNNIVDEFLKELSHCFQARETAPATQRDIDQARSDGTPSQRQQPPPPSSGPQPSAQNFSRPKPHKLQYVTISGGKPRWSDGTRKLAKTVAAKYVKKMAEATAPLTDMISQFWDNVASMTYPICKFEHGKNRFIFRLATGELCTGRTVEPRLTLDEFETNAGVTGTAPNVTGRVLFRRIKPDLQPVTSDYAIDCSVNVLLGRRRVLGMRERRALRMNMILANYTRYNLNMAENTNGVFHAAGMPGGDGATKKAAFTVNMPPDLVALLLCNQTVSVVRYKGIAIITGFLFRGQQVDLFQDNVTLHAKIRGEQEEPYHRIVNRLITKNDSSEWKADICGAVRVLATSKSVFLLTREHWGSPDSYRLHEMSDVIAYASQMTIFVL